MLAKANNMIDSEFCSFAKRLFYENAHVLIESFAVLRPSVSLLGRFVCVWIIELDTQT